MEPGECYKWDFMESEVILLKLDAGKQEKGVILLLAT
jgi:hypothetical protein